MELPPSQPLVVSYGMGVDSTAVLVGLVQRRIRPDLILFANVGNEKVGTYAYLPIIQSYLAVHGFPPVTVVRYMPRRFKNWPPYRTLLENCVSNATLPSVSFGYGGCSQKWKGGPMEKFIEQWPVAQQAWLEGKRAVKVIGYDCSPRDCERRTYADEEIKKKSNADRYDWWYPLQEWGWERPRCEREIAQAGLPVPPKSSCYMCLAMKPEEVEQLTREQLRRLVLLEARAKPHLNKVEGLWRTSSKARPGSMSEFIQIQGLLPAEEIQRIQQVPTERVRMVKGRPDPQAQAALAKFLDENFPGLYTEDPIGEVMSKPIVGSTQQCLFNLDAEAA